MSPSYTEIKRESFTLREFEVLSMIAQGLTNQEISGNLHISIETVKWYAKQIYPKLGVTNRTKAALIAEQAGILKGRTSSTESGKKFVKSNNLPTQVTSYIGRDREISDIKQLMGENRLVTLTGPGGIGKTRLALHVARDLLYSYKDGIWLVELARINDPDEVVNTIAKVLDVSERNGQPIENTLTTYLSTKNLLLIIDNFEHLLAASVYLGGLLANAPQLAILTTSRERLHVYGEVEYQVSPLDIPDFQRSETVEKLLNYDSIRLFVVRAQSAQPDFNIEKGQIQSVARICRLLDGLPLAIELSAPLVKLFSPSQIAERLEKDIDTLPAGPRDLPARHRTLRATLEWSYKLLSKDEKLLFSNLAVFKHGGTLEAIEFICSDQHVGRFLNTLTALVNRNLLIPEERRDGEIYFKMLETTLLLSEERLISNKNAENAQTRFVEYYIHLAERAKSEYSSHKNKYWFLRLQMEQNNIRSAIEWTIKNNDFGKCLKLVFALKNYWRNYGYQKEGLKWAEVCLAKSASEDSSIWAGVLLTAGEYCLDLYQDSKAEEYLKESLRIFKKLGDKQHSAWCYALLGVAEIGSTQDMSRGIDMAQESLEVFRQLDDKGGMAYVYNLLGELARVEGEFQKAERFYKLSLELAKETGERLREGTQYSNLGILSYQKNEYEKAKSFTKKGLRIFFEMDAYYGIVYDIGGLAGAEMALGNPGRAACLLGASNAGLEALESFHQYADKTVISEIFNKTKAMLDEKSFLEFWEKGQRMTFQEAFEYALDEYDQDV